MISVIIPVYNVEKYLNRCVDCVLGQTYQDFEIILVDDESEDRSPLICDEYAQKDSRIKVIHQKNQGANLARGAGFKASVGEFVCFLDSDDYIEPNFLETLYNEFDPQTDMVIASYFVNLENRETSIIYEKREILKERFAEDLLKPSVFKLTGDKYYYEVFIWLRLYRRSVIDNDCFIPQKEIYTEDLFFELYATRNSRKVKTVDIPLYHYCPHDDSLINRYRPNKPEMVQKKEKLITEYSQNCGISLESERLKGLKARHIIGCIYNSFSQRNYKLFKKDCLLLSSLYKDLFKYKDIPFESVKKKILFLSVKYRLFFLLYVSLRVKDFVK